MPKKDLDFMYDRNSYIAVKFKMRPNEEYNNLRHTNEEIILEYRGYMQNNE